MTLYVLVVDILKMCMWVFDVVRIRQNYGVLNLVNFGSFLHCKV